MIQQAPPPTPDAGPARPSRGRWSAPAAAVAALALGVLSTACGDDILRPQWSSSLDTVQLFTLARPELNLPSAFSFNRRRTFRVEGAGSTGNWDLALDTREGQLVFLPPGALGISSRAGVLMRADATFDEVTEAPTDTAEYTSDGFLPVELGAVYVVRTGQSIGTIGTRCVYFAKLEPLEMDAGVGTVRFKYEANPFCNDPELVPTADED